MLNAVEFKAKIKQGIIEIPEEYQQDLREDSEVQVIVIGKKFISYNYDQFSLFL